MGSSRWSDNEIACALKWKLVRSHGWSGPIPEEDLVRDALPASEVSRGREVCETLKRKEYITYQRGRGFTLKGMPEQAVLARELRDECSYTELQIEATLSPFGRAGGFK